MTRALNGSSFRELPTWLLLRNLLSAVAFRNYIELPTLNPKPWDQGFRV